MSNAPLRVGLVGANAEHGWATWSHVPALKALPRFRLEGVSARTRENAEAGAKAYGAARAFGDTYELVRSPDIDVVTICCKVPEHRPIVLAALEAGKHIFCEWPLGRDVAEAEELAAAAKKAKGRVIIGCQGTAAPAARRAAEIIASGALGRLRTARVVSPSAGWTPDLPAFYGYLNRREFGATMTAIPGGHTLAVVLQLLGHFTEVQAQTTIQHPKVRIVDTGEIIERDCPDHFAMIGRHANGCVSVVDVDAGRDPTTRFWFEVMGDQGELRLTGDGGFQTGMLQLETTMAGPPPAPVVAGLTGPAANVGEVYMQLAATIDTGRQHGFDFEFAADLTRLLAAMDHAAESGRRVRLDAREREVQAA